MLYNKRDFENCKPKELVSVSHALVISDYEIRKIKMLKCKYDILARMTDTL